MHAEGLNLVLLQNILLFSVNVSEPDVNELLDADFLIRLEPSKYIIPFLCRQAREKRDWHAVNIAAEAGLRRIDIRMRIHPYHGHFSSQSLSYGFCCAWYCTNGYWVVTSECEDKTTLLGMLIHLFADPFCHSTNGKRTLHIPINWILCWLEGWIWMNGLIMMKVVAQFLLQLGENACGNQSNRSSINAFFALGRVSWVDWYSSYQLHTWPPEKPTATTPRSLLAVRNLDWTVDGDVILN